MRWHSQAVLYWTVNQPLRTEDIVFYPGVSYRHVLVWHRAPFDFQLTPPHDMIGRKIKEYLPGGPYGNLFLTMMQKSGVFLKNHPVNVRRRDRGLRPGNSIWFWGEGKKPALSSFYDKYGLKAPLFRQSTWLRIGLCAGLESIDVEGVTGNYHTNYEGKAGAALQALEGQDFVYIHLEGRMMRAPLWNTKQGKVDWSHR